MVCIPNLLYIYCILIDQIQEIHQMTEIKNRPFLLSKFILTSKLKILPTISSMNKNVDIHLSSILSQNVIYFKPHKLSKIIIFHSLKSTCIY